MLEAYRQGSTWRRIAILLGVLLGLALLPLLIVERRLREAWVDPLVARP